MLALRPALFAVGLLASCAAAVADEMKFELYKDKVGEFRWRLKDKAGETAATPGQSFKAKADAKNNIESLKKSADKDSKATFEVYEDAKKEHRWRLKASNGQTIASSSAAFKTKADADKAVEAIKAGLPKATVVEVKDEK